MSQRPAPAPARLVRPLAFAALVAALLVPLVASADLAPFPRETCTVEYQTLPGEVCEACYYSMAADMQSCAERYEGSGMTERCRTASNGTSWTEVWCGPPSAPEGSGEGAGLPVEAPLQRASFLTAVADAAPGGCTTSGRGGAAGGALICLAIAGVAAGALRRRQG
jgi:hypothetical protein